MRSARSHDAAIIAEMISAKHRGHQGRRGLRLADYSQNLNFQADAEEQTRSYTESKSVHAGEDKRVHARPHTGLKSIHGGRDNNVDVRPYTGPKGFEEHSYWPRQQLIITLMYDHIRNQTASMLAKIIAFMYDQGSEPRVLDYL